MAEPQYVVIAGFPNADFMAVALDKDGAAIREDVPPVDFMREMNPSEAYPAPEIRMTGPKDYAVEYKKMPIKGKYVTDIPVFRSRFCIAADTRKKTRRYSSRLIFCHAFLLLICLLRRNCPLTPLERWRLARYVPLRRIVHHENKKLGVSATFLRLGPSRPFRGCLMADFHKPRKSMIRELAIIANKKIAVRTAFLFLSPKMPLKWRHGRG